jgi:excisionase family DNA binding protein
MASPKHVQETLLTPAEVAAVFRVDPKTVTRWAVSGKLTAVRTLGGHRRYRADEVMQLLHDGTSSPVVATSPAIDS